MNSKSSDSAEGMKAASSRRISDLTFEYHFYTGRRSGQGKELHIQYIPLTQEDDGNFSDVRQLSGYIRLDDWAQVPPEICQKLETLERVVAPLLPSYEIDVDRSGSLKIAPTINEIFATYFTKPPTGTPGQLSILYVFQTAPNQSSQANISWDSLSRSQQLVVSNVTSWVKKQAWEDLANKVRAISGQPAQKLRSHKVFLSYKKLSKAEQVAETIAHRLSQQRIEVWFDKWEIKAGESVAGKIGEGFKESDACLVFLESRYSSSDWCTKEMNTALTKAIDEDFTVIPILVEDCEKPELLKGLKHIYLKEPSHSEFEQKLTEITDAIYRVDLNPYR